jgi:hypothetical protein
MHNTNIALLQGANSQRLGSIEGFPYDYYWTDLIWSQCNNPTYVGEFQDFRGDAIPAYWVEAADNSGTVAVNAQRGGVVRFTTGTTGANYATLTAGLHWRVSNGYTRFTARVASISAITTRTIEIGLTDATTETGGLIFSDHDATPVAVADNAVFFGFDTGDSMTTWGVYSVNATTAGAQNLVTPAPAAGTFQKFDIIVDSAGNASCYIDGTLVKYIATAVATTAVLTPWVGVTTLTTSAAIIDADYVGIVGVRG